MEQQNEWILRAIFNYGFPSVMVIALSVGAWKLINIIIKNNKEREEAYLKLIENGIAVHTKAINDLSDSLRDLRTSNDEAHRYQREEHKLISDAIRGVCKA